MRESRATFPPLVPGHALNVLPKYIGGPALKPCDENIRQTLRLASRMIALSEKGEADREDTGCGILYGVLRDSAYKLIQLAEQEKKAHMDKGWWR